MKTSPRSDIYSYFPRILAIYFLAGIVATQAALWEKYPLNDLVSDSPLIVVGEIVRFKEITHKSEAFDIAYIRVEKVLKNSLPETRSQLNGDIPLWMPSTRDESMSTADVRHSNNARGIWFLKPTTGEDRGRRLPKGIFHTRHPDELQPLKIIKKVERTIANTESK